MYETLITLIIIISTIIVYLAMYLLYRRFPLPLFLPILTTTVLIIAFLKFAGIAYEAYMTGGQWFNRLLGPAVVAFAYPLYQQRKVILKNLQPITAGVLTGLVTGIVTVLLFAKWPFVPEQMLYSLIPKSLTTPVAIEVSDAIGGSPSLTAAFVIIAGMTGAIFGPFLFKWFRIDSTLGAGIAMGSASHAIGTSKAFEYGPLAGSLSSLSMTLSAIIGPIVCILLF
ncbi:MAG: LrgB family protein [Bacillales bacterium]